MELSGQIALITGGGGGIGEATALLLAERGATVVVADIDGGAADRVATSIDSAGRKAVAVQCDHTDPDAVAGLVATVDDLGGPDICFANAGYGKVAPFLDQRYEDWRAAYEVNVHGTFLVCQAAARSMVRRGRGGAIILTTSSGAEVPAALFGAYCSSKAALNMLVKVMAYELGAYDIRVNAVMPGTTVTGMTQRFVESGGDALLAREIPLGRLARPAEIADVVAFLASSASRYVTGSAYLVDGGGTLFANSWFETDFTRRGETDWQIRSTTPASH